jgi:predicted MFS family arabinose efflux permease
MAGGNPLNKAHRHYRWVVVAVFFMFMLLHQSDRLLISPLTTDIMADFKISKTQMGAIVSGALLVGAVLFPIWGYLYDRFSRAKLLALASAIWGSTTWLSALAPTFPTFIAARATTGIDDSSYPGLYSLISDYFGPLMRGRIYGLLQLTQPLGYLIGMSLALALGPLWGWRRVFFLTGSLGLVVALIILALVRDAPRGRSEPEMAGLEQVGVYRFDPRQALALFHKPSLLLLFAQGFVGVFPWNVIAFWFFAYLETERHYLQQEMLFTMGPAVLVLALGYFAGGAAGDFAFKRTDRGRLLVSMAAVLIGALLLVQTMSVPIADRRGFLLLLLLTALFIPFASANVISTVYDVTLPEVRSTALAIQYFIEDGGSALAPLLAGYIADQSSLHHAILLICVGAWIIGSCLLGLTAYLVPRDIATLRQQLRLRADQERQRQMVSGG